MLFLLLNAYVRIPLERVRTRAGTTTVLQRPSAPGKARREKRSRRGDAVGRQQIRRATVAATGATAASTTRGTCSIFATCKTHRFSERRMYHTCIPGVPYLVPGSLDARYRGKYSVSFSHAAKIVMHARSSKYDKLQPKPHNPGTYIDLSFFP